MNITRKKILLPLLFIALLAFVTVAGFLTYSKLSSTPAYLSPYNQSMDDGLMDTDLQRLSTEAYSGVFLSMHSNSGYREEDFKAYRGLDVLVAQHAISNSTELSQYLDLTLSSDNIVTNVYLTPDPELLWLEAKENPKTWEQILSTGLCRYLENYPHISFEILLPYPHMDYWLSLKDEDFKTVLTLYHSFMTQVSAYSNTTVYFPGFEEWVLVNPDNFTTSLFDANDILALKIMLLTFCDKEYVITPTNADFFWNNMREMISAEKAAPSVYPDLSDWDIVFFGDSVIGNFKGSISQPGHVSGLTKATTYNLAVGGSSAGNAPNAGSYFSQALDRFLAAKQTFHGKELYFVINFGLNDYFCGIPTDHTDHPYDINTFAGGIRTGIKRLQEAYPQAHYILVSPTHTSIFENGALVNGELGSPLSEYIFTGKKIANELQIPFVDNYNDFLITAENIDDYLSDGVHPNQKGQLTLAKRLIRFIEENVL